MLRILNETTNLNDINDINLLGKIRFEKYSGFFKPTNNIKFLTFENDIYVPKEWKYQSEKYNIILSTSTVINSNYVAFKMETTCSCNINKAVEYLSNVENIPSYNHTTESTKIIKKFSDNNVIYRLVAPSIYGVASRDFILCNNVNYNETDNSYYIYSLSVDNDSINKRFSKNNKHVRGNIIITGYYLKPISEDVCIIKCISHIEVNGVIPTIAVNNLINEDTLKVFKSVLENISK